MAAPSYGGLSPIGPQTSAPFTDYQHQNDHARGLTNYYRSDQVNSLCRTTIPRRQYYRHIFVHRCKKPSLLAKLVYGEGDCLFISVNTEVQLQQCIQ